MTDIPTPAGPEARDIPFLADAAPDEALRFQARLLDAVEQAVIATDLAGTVLYWNRFAERLYGWSAAEVQGRNIVEITPDLTSQPLAAEIMARLVAGQSWSGEFLVRRKDGTTFPALVTDSPIYDGQGQLVGIVGVSSDISDRIRAEEMLREQAHAERLARADAEAANRAKSDFLGIMSHELRTPLSAIIGYGELLADGITGPVTAAQREQLVRIRASAHHLLGLIDEILGFARVEAGREMVAAEPVDPRAVMDQAVALVAPLAADKGLALHVRVPQRLPTVVTDPGKIRQILVNLLGNAVKYTERGEIVASARDGGGAVTFEVRDTGIGIAPQHLGKIFDPFWQADQTATRRSGGTGLGLSVTRRLADLLGAEVSVESRMGEGTTFTVRVPVGVETRDSGFGIRDS